MKKLLVAILILVVAVVVVGIASPTEYSLDRKITIAASPSAVHAFVGDLEKWPLWTPWLELDPTIKTTYGKTTTGVGASQTWTGEDAGGELTLTMSDPSKGVAYDMAFIMDDVSSPCTSSILYTVVDGGTEVTWSMTGDWKGIMPPVMDGIMQLMSGMLIGGDFDSGLEKLKTLVEAKA